MRTAEFSSFSQEPPTSDGSEVRYARSSFRRRTKSHQHSAGASPDVPAVPERPDLDIHRERVAAQVKDTFDAVDAGVSRMIGFPGNIREELRRRRLESTGPLSHQRRLNTQGLDPALQRYLQNDIFFFRLDNPQGDPAAIYQIDCQTGRFIPSIQVERTDGFVEASLRMGRNDDKFDTVEVRRGFDDGSVRRLTTFESYDPYAPPHPLVISQGQLLGSNSQVIYDNIDEAGNVTPLDGQFVTDPSGNFTGEYSATDHTISASATGRPFPYEVSGSELVIGEPGYRQAHFPMQTNIYTELEAIGTSIGAIGSD